MKIVRAAGIAGTALVLLLTGCSGSDEKEVVDVGVSQALVDCATDTYRLRREVDLMLDTVKDGINVGIFEAIAGGIAEERDSAADCPAEVEKDMSDVLGAVDDLGVAVRDYYDCRSKTCNQTAEADLTSASASASYSLRRVDRTITDDALEAGEAAVQETPLEEARVTCLADASLEDPVRYMTIGDEGRTMTLQLGSGEVEDEVATSGCVLGELNVPDSTRDLVDATTSLMGRQTDTWDDYEMSWSYHPDNGLNAVIELVES